MGVCLHCGKEAEFKCIACKEAVYCSKGCQGADWEMEHSVKCGAAQIGAGLDDAVGNIQTTFNDIIGKKFVGKTPVKPTFIISYGPPGSGKSTVVKNLYEKAERRIREDEVVDVDVDQIVTAIPGYKEELADLGEGDRKEKSELYRRAREGADTISSKLLDEALLRRYSVRWETTGGQIQWTAHEIDRIKRKGYRIWIVYPVVEPGELEDRINNREKETGQTAMDPKVLTDVIMKSQENLHHLFGLVDRVIVYDNTLQATRHRKNGRILFELETKYGEWGKKAGPIGRVVSCVHCADLGGFSTKLGEKEFYEKVLGKNLYLALVKSCEMCMMKNKNVA